MRLFAVLLAVVAPVTALAAAPPAAPPMADAAAVEAEMARLMRATGAQGWAVAVVDQGKVAQVHAAGQRNAAGDPLTTDTVMYGASLTKMAFAYMVMQLVDEGVLDLDRPIGE